MKKMKDQTIIVAMFVTAIVVALLSVLLSLWRGLDR